MSVSVREHDGKMCYRIIQTHPSKEDRYQIVYIGNRRVLAIEHRWSGSWWLYEPFTGETIGSIGISKFDSFVTGVESELINDPDC